MTRSSAAHALNEAHRQLNHDRTIDLELASANELLDVGSRHETGIDSLVGVLDSAMRLPPTLTVRIAIPDPAALTTTEVDAFRDRCRAQASDSWREAMSLRQGGFRELPRALLLSFAAAVIGVVSGSLAQGIDGTVTMVVLYAVAFISVVAAWTIGWAPIEQALFDWRAPGHTSAGYELLSRAKIDVVRRPGDDSPEVTQPV